LGAERGTQGIRNEGHREGSQTLRMGLPARKAKVAGRFLERGSEEEGFLILKNAEGAESLSEELIEDGSWSAGDIGRRAA